MAVAVQVDFDGGTTDQYDAVLEKMGLTKGGPGPAGTISHFVTMTETGLRVVDVWETAEQFKAFAQEQMAPLAVEAGLGRPRMEFFEVHNYFQPNPS